MSTHDPTGKTTGARQVILVRHRADAIRPSEHPVHLLPLPARAESNALCGVRLSTPRIETVIPGQGVPCTLCFLVHLAGNPLPPPAPPPACAGTAAEPVMATSHYHALGWPVTLRRNQVLLSLGNHAVALIIPTTQATDVTALLITRRCPAPVLTHPHVTQHRIIVAGAPFGVPLPWPDDIRTVTGHLLLPPTRLPAGPITWTQLPHDHTLDSCREIDVYSAVRRLSCRIDRGGGPRT